MSLWEKGKVLLKVSHLFVDNNDDIYQDFRIVGVMLCFVKQSTEGVMQMNHWVFSSFLFIYIS